MTTAIKDPPKATMPARTRKPAASPVVSSKVDDPETTSEDQAPPETTPETTAEAVEPTSAPPYPPFIRPTPDAMRERRTGLKLSRAGLSELAKISASRVWASETPGKDVTDDHIKALVAAMDHVDEHGLPEHLRPKPSGVAAKTGVTKADLESRVKTALLILEEAAGKKTLAELRALIEQTAAALSGASEEGGDAK